MSEILLILVTLSGFFLGLSLGLMIAHYLFLKCINRIVRELDKVIE